MQDKLLKKIISDYSGAGGEKLVQLLFGKQNVNEFLIAKKMNLTINQTRNMLYRLADEGLVRFIRKKDKKKGGWYTYFWTLETEKSLLKYKEKLQYEIKKLNHDLENRKKERYYYCINGDGEYSEENALLNNYTCTECGETLEIKNSEELLKGIESGIKRIEAVLLQINKELEEINKKKEKTKDRRIKKEIKEKQLEREKRKKERAREKKKAHKNKTSQKKKASHKKIKKLHKKKSSKKKRWITTNTEET